MLQAPPEVSMPDLQASPKDQFRYKIIEGAKARMRPMRTHWQQHANMYRGQNFERASDMSAWGDGYYEGEEDGILVENNHLFAWADTLVANVSPPNPEVSILSRRQELEESAKLREAIINDCLYKEKAHERLWKMVTRAVIYPRSFLKVVWSKKRGRPTLRVINPEYVFFDAMAEDWDDMRYICEVVVLTRAEFEKRVKKQGKKGGFYRHDAMDDVKFGVYPNWLVDPDSGLKDLEGSDHEVVRKGYEWVTVFEFYDLVEEKFLHYLDGCARPLVEAKLPYVHLPNPFIMLTFNDNLRDLGGLSDAELVYPTIERMNELSSLKLWHIKTAIPVTILHSGLVDDPAEFEDAMLAASGPGQVVTLAAKPHVNVDQVIGQSPTSQLPIEWERAEQQLMEIVELILGMAAYQRGATGQGDIATEFALADTAIRTRNARRQKAVYDVIAAAGKAIIALYAQFLDDDVWLPVQADSNGNYMDVNRQALMLDREEKPFDYDYQARPFNAQEGNSVVQMKVLTEFLPVWTENPNIMPYVNVPELVKKMFELFQMPELFQKEPSMPGQGVGGMPGADLGTEADAGGATLGAAPALPPDAMPANVGGQVMVGNGAQAVPGGLEGGRQ